MVNQVHMLADAAAAEVQSSLFDKVQMITLTLQDEAISVEELEHSKYDALRSYQHHSERKEYYEARQYEKLMAAYEDEIFRRIGQYSLPF